MLTGAGSGFYRRSSLLFDADPGDGERWMTVGPFAGSARQEGPYVREDVFDLLPFQRWILPCLNAGGVTFRVETRTGEESRPFAAWMMDYSALRASGEAGTRIPEAGTLAMLSIGVAVLLMLRRRRAR